MGALVSKWCFEPREGLGAVAEGSAKVGARGEWCGSAWRHAPLEECYTGTLMPTALIDSRNALIWRMPSRNP